MQAQMADYIADFVRRKPGVRDQHI
jgi:hypothetical protein